MVRRLEVERRGLLLSGEWTPHGSEADTEPLREDSLRERVGLRDGLLEGETTGSTRVVMVA